MSQPAVGRVFLSFMPHFCDVLGIPEDVDAATMNPGFFTPSDVTRTAGLQAIVDRRILGHPDPRLKAAFTGLRFSLVDLTGDKIVSPQFAGHREKEQGGLGSMAKTACMFAAYQLKFDLETLARKQGISSQEDLFAAARKSWSETQKQDAANVTLLFPANPKIELFGKLIVIDGKPLPLLPSFGAPDLEKIFKKSSQALPLLFDGSDRILVDPTVPGNPATLTKAVVDYHDKFPAGNLKAVRDLSFAERLFLMVDESDNAATHSCMENVSFAYIASALWQSDLYRPERGGGLWEGKTHAETGFQWAKPPVPRGNPKADFISTTPAAIASLLTLIEQRRLVSPDSCTGMLQLMSKKKTGFNLVTQRAAGSFTRSFLGEGIRDARLPIVRIHSKLGIADFQNDCVIITRDVPTLANPAVTQQIRYAAAAFDDTGEVTLQKIGLTMDECIRENNGLL